MVTTSKGSACACGCGERTGGGTFKPGHDAKLFSAMVKAVGGVQELRAIVENHLGKPIVVAQAAG